MWTNYSKLRRSHYSQLLNCLRRFNNPRHKYEKKNVLYVLDYSLNSESISINVFYDSNWHKIRFTSYFKENINNYSVAIHNNNIYLGGGFNQLNPIKSVKRLDFIRKSICEIAALNICSGAFAFTSSNDGLYAAGGNIVNHLRLEALNSFEYYEFSKNKWINLPKMNNKRSNFQLIIFGDFIYAIGGRDSSSVALSSVEKYDIKKKK